MSIPLFGALSVVLIAAALGVVLQRSPIRCALSLVVTLFTLAVFFVFLDAHLVAALQVIVYAGAIMVLFLFVIMLLNLQQDVQVLAGLGTRAAAVVIGSLFLFGALHFVRAPVTLAGGAGMAGPIAAGFGTTELLAERLFTQFLLPFEITSVLLLVAIIGAVVLAKRTLV